jgi:enoyl ACP reductase
MKITRPSPSGCPVTPPVVELDVSNPEHLDTLAERLREHTDRLDGVLHSIGFAPQGAFTFLDATWEDVGTAVHVSAYSLKALAVAALPLMERGRLDRRADLRRELRVAGLRLDGRGQGGLRVDQPLLRPRPRAQGHPLQPRRRRPDPHDGRQVHPRLRGLRGGSGTPAPRSAGTSTDPVPTAKACVALLSDWFPATTGEIVHVDGGVPRHGLLSVPVDRSGELRCTTRLARHGASARR